MKGFRVLAFNAVMAVLALLTMFGVIAPSDAPDAGAINSVLDHFDSILLVVVPLGNAILRFFTNTAVFTKV